MPPGPLRNSAAKRWCFTLNNYTQEELAEVHRYVRENCHYAVVGAEKAATSTRHLQGYMHLRRKSRISSLKSGCFGRAHLEVAKGSALDNTRYCSKEDRSPFIHGEIPTSVGREDLKGPSRDELAETFSASVRAEGHTGIVKWASINPGAWFFDGRRITDNFLMLHRPEDRPGIYVEWLWGQPGVGKSRKAHMDLPAAYIKEPRTKWWTGYLLEKTVIIDDFGPNSIDINHLLRWFDRYKCLVETKGGMVPLLADRFIVTSNFTPQECFTDKEGVIHRQVPALLRRVTVIAM